MSVSKKTACDTRRVAQWADIADRFEAALDYVPSLDRVTFSVKREAAEAAAQAVIAFLHSHGEEVA